MCVLHCALSSVLLSGKPNQKPALDNLLCNRDNLLQCHVKCVGVQRILKHDCTLINNAPARKMSDESVFMPWLQKKVNFTWVTRANEDSVRALVYEQLHEEQFDIVLNSLKGNDMFVCLTTWGAKGLSYACLPLVHDCLWEVISKSIAIVTSPSNALMQDQVISSSNHGMTAVHVDSDCSPALLKLETQTSGPYNTPS